MKTLTLTLAAAALALGATALSANAQQLGAGHAQLQNATPIVKQAACRGFRCALRPGIRLDLRPLRPLLVPALRLSGLLSQFRSNARPPLRGLVAYGRPRGPNSSAGR